MGPFPFCLGGVIFSKRKAKLHKIRFWQGLLPIGCAASDSAIRLSVRRLCKQIFAAFGTSFGRLCGAFLARLGYFLKTRTPVWDILGRKVLFIRRHPFYENTYFMLCCLCPRRGQATLGGYGGSLGLNYAQLEIGLSRGNIIKARRYYKGRGTAAM